MTSPVIVDTGPLVAFLNARDRHHAWARGALGRVQPPLLTCESVLSEVAFLVRGLTGGTAAVLELVQRGLVAIRFRLDDETAAVARLLHRYRHVPMALADACLVRMSETVGNGVVLTLDSDFGIYGRNGRDVIPLLAPPAPSGVRGPSRGVRGRGPGPRRSRG